MATRDRKEFRTEFPKCLRVRSLSGLWLVISDHHLGLKGAIETVFVGAIWQRCRVHFMRNVLANVPRGQAPMVAAAIRTIFAQPDVAHVQHQLKEPTSTLKRQFPTVAEQLLNASDEITAFKAFPISH